MKFMMLVCVDPGRFAEDEAADTAENGDADNMGSFPWLDDVIARGIRLHGDRLRPAEEAKTVLVRDGEVLVSDGPFAETKEIICGYDMLECGSLEEAVQVASAHPVARFGKIEVRAVWTCHDGSVHGPAQSLYGRGVAAGVHGVGQQHHPQAARRVQGQAGAGEAGVRHGRRRPPGAQDVEGVAGAGPAVAAAAAEVPGLAGGRGPAQGGRDHGVVVADPPGGEASQVVR